MFIEENTVCVHQVIDIVNNDVTVAATSVLDGIAPAEILAGGVGWTPDPENTDPIDNITLTINTDDDAELLMVSLTTEGVDNVIVDVLKDGVVVDTFMLTPPGPGPQTLSLDYLSDLGTTVIGDTIVLRVLEDLDPSTPTRVGDLVIEACYHPNVSSTVSPVVTTTVSSLTSVLSSVVSSVSSSQPQGWSEWSPWGDCTVTCGVGISTRFRECEADNAGFVGVNPCAGVSSETKECVKEDCPTNPNWTEWTPWSVCDVLCGEGVQVRYRECNDPPPLPGQTGCIGPNAEELTCEMPSCACVFDTSAFENVFGYQPGEVVGWMEKDGVQGPTDPDELVMLGDQVGSDTIIYVECNECECNEGSFACNASACEDCTYSPWSEWTQCTQTCDVGQRTRTRDLISGANQQTCVEPRTETEDCNTNLCEVVEEWSTWSEWSNCSTSEPCESGIQTRTRSCTGDNCPGDSLEIEVCGEPCENDNCTNGRVWANCSFECPQTCEDFRLNDFCTPSDACLPGCACPEGFVTSVDGTCVQQDTCPCYTPDGVPVWPGFPYNPTNEPCKTCICSTNHTLVCNVDPECCDWDEWTSWGECDVTCGEGTRNRYREQVSGVNCGSNLESQSCILGDCPPGCVHDGVDYEYGDLISDDFCEKCYCTIENSYYCVNDTFNSVDGEWADWGMWSMCTSSCDGGSRVRTRTCSDPIPKCGGLMCPGDNTETEPCNEFDCCETTPYSQWSDCSQSCDNGTQSRTREYVDPQDAVICNETLVDTQECNYIPCDATCVISDWSEWTPCSASCGTGVRSRSFDIITPASDCPDTSSEYQDCYAGDCPCLTSQVWSNTSLCQRTCDERYDFNESRCVEPSEGCICEDGLYLDTAGNCINDTECDVCRINGAEYQPGDLFDHPDDACYSCECVSGMEECNRKCDIPTCAPGEELTYDVPNACCPICVPVPDTCQKYSKFEVLYDETSDCITPEEVEITYCSGGCGNSTSTSILMLSANAESLASECSCCSATIEEIIPVPVVCGASQTPRTAYMAMIAECKCSICLSTESTP